MQNILALKVANDQKILQLGTRAQNASKLLRVMYGLPIIDAKQVALELGISATSANTLLRELERLGIIRETTGFARNRLYEYTDYLNLFR